MMFPSRLLLLAMLRLVLALALGAARRAAAADAAEPEHDTRADLGARVSPEPGRQDCGLVIGQYANRSADGQIDEHQAVAWRSSVQ
jgi:hypothetical protein